MEDKNKNLNKSLEDFLGKTPEEGDCKGECLIKGDKSLIERINKKVVTEDGRQLLT